MYYRHSTHNNVMNNLSRQSLQVLHVHYWVEVNEENILTTECLQV